MTDNAGTGGDDSWAGAKVAVPDDVAAAARATVDAPAVSGTGRPRWVNQFVWQSLWKAVVVGLSVALGLAIVWRTQTLIRMLLLSFFFALAMIPAVRFMHERWGWKRGAAVGAIYLGFVVFLIGLVAFMIPAALDFADEISASGGSFADTLNGYSQDVIGQDIVDQQTGTDAGETAGAGVSKFTDNIAGVAMSGLGMLFNLATVLMFTFYMAADSPRIERALMSRMPPHRQKVFGWVWDTAIEQTGGYFYSRILLMVINGGLFFVAMLLVGMPLLYAIPLAIFEGFVAEFIPAIGTYLGAAIPILLALVLLGLPEAVILLVWVLIYQQAENYWLSPKISSNTMELNGAVAFGAALAGGAIAGPMGAFAALPIAALITSIIKNTGKSYDVAYQSDYDSADDHTDTLPSPRDNIGGDTTPADA
jgi:predicted PurR-regulated permease PerM